MPSKTVVIVNSKLPDGENTATVYERAAEIFIAAGTGWKLAPKADQPKTEPPKS